MKVFQELREIAGIIWRRRHVRTWEDLIRVIEKEIHDDRLKNAAKTEDETLPKTDGN